MIIFSFFLCYVVRVCVCVCINLSLLLQFIFSRCRYTELTSLFYSDWVLSCSSLDFFLSLFLVFFFSLGWKENWFRAKKERVLFIDWSITKKKKKTTPIYIYTYSFKRRKRERYIYTEGHDVASLLR